MQNNAEFICLQCGTCCRNLIENRNGRSSGITLTKNETSLFRSEIVVPKIALGMYGPEIFLFYQLVVNCCPYIDEKNQCKIYEKRPLICRSFPIISGAISNKCQVYSYRKVGLTYDEPYKMTLQLAANNKLEKYFQNQIKKNFKKGIKLWEYDFSTKHWIYKMQLNNLP
ncbi:MAG: YkgJ family cysteine cluster protein [Crenarchaeota archaeon]|nr:YkgJ family cysteine cluster protein [Thermoproteota archaeon]